MLGERVFSYKDFNIDPAHERASDELRHAVSTARLMVKHTNEARTHQIVVGGVWPRGDDFYFEVFPTSLYEEAGEAAQSLPGL